MGGNEWSADKELLHGQHGHGARRYCAACEEWVGLMDWQEHKDHGGYRLDFDTVDIGNNDTNND